MATLLLIRHGPSAHEPPAFPMRRHEVEQWRAHYDAAGIRPDAEPPTPLVHIARRADVHVASDMVRARESAEKLAGQQTVVYTPLLREAPLVIPRWPTPLPFRLWGALIYLAWKTGEPLGTSLDRVELARVEEATRYLGDIVRPGATGVVVTHGVFRALLAVELKRKGWRETERTGGYGHWSAWRYVQGG